MDPHGPAPARLTVAMRSGSILVRTGSGSDVEVHGGKVRVEPDGTYRIEGGSKSIEVICPAGSDVILGTSSGKVSLEGPLGDVRITGSSGTVDVDQARSLDLRVRSGSVVVGAVVGECRVVSSSGRIEVGSAGSVDLSGVSGTIVAGAVGGGTVRTTSGRVTIGLDRAGDLEVRGVSGTTEITVPRGVAPELRLATVSGKIKRDLEEGHDGVISVRTVSGTIRLRWV
jgi:DUF4097 and DUF4098 domain-containing protein YvlB